MIDRQNGTHYPVDERTGGAFRPAGIGRKIVAVLLPFLLASGCATAVPQGRRSGSMPAYPVILVHGLGARDDSGIVDHWGTVPETLRARGADVFLPGQDSFGTIETNAARLKDCILEVLAETGAKKVNLVGHSKGGLESRYAVSTLGCAPLVASVTTIATPHRGTYVAQYYYERLPAKELIYGIADLIARLFGDESPAVLEATRRLTPAAMAEFNRSNPDAPGVYYQSYAVGVTGSTASPITRVTYDLLEPMEGPNDGLVSLASARWGAFKGIVCMDRDGTVSVEEHPDPSLLTISHQDATGYGGFLIDDFYVLLAEDLAKMGF